MKTVKLGEYTLHIAEAYKRKHSKKVNAAMFEGMNVPFDLKQVDKAEDVPMNMEMPIGNQDKANEALIIAMIEKAYKGEVECLDVLEVVDDLTNSEYMELLKECQMVQTASLTQKGEAKKS